MQNKDRITNQKSNKLDNDIERLKSNSRLSLDDKKIFALNLGKLAIRIDEDKPLNGAKQITDKSGQEGIWQKRKRYFRFPDEDTPDNGKGGEYASNPLAFIALAQAAGELLCKSAKPESIERERLTAVKSLITGSSYSPSYVPSNSADISAVALLDEYAQVLAEAIESRTTITELWKVLETTEIGIEYFREDEAEPSPYGDAANFPKQLFDNYFRESFMSGESVISSSQFTTDGYKPDDSWAFPSVKLGYVATTHQIRMFCIPEEQRTLCSGDDTEIVSALRAIDFDFGNFEIPEYDLNDRHEGAGWKQVTASIIHKLSLSIEKNETGGVEIKISILPLRSDDGLNPDIYLIHSSGRGENYEPRTKLMAAMHDLAEKEMQLIKSGFKISQMMEIGLKNSSHNNDFTEDDDDDYDDHIQMEFIYDEFFNLYEHNKLLPIAILPEWWIENGGENWLSNEDFNHFRENIDADGWTEGEFQAKILLGSEDIRFYPSNPEAKPIAGVLRAGSVGASLLQNLKAQNEANSITNQLIEKTALTADAGLKFYEAILEQHRSDIRKI
jgi:hypothetical protein